MADSSILKPYHLAGYGIVALETMEDSRVLELCDSLDQRGIYSIAASGGLLEEGENGRIIDGSVNFSRAFEWAASQQEIILIVRDFQHVISGPAAYRPLLRFLPAIKARGNMIVLLAPFWNLPPELKREMPVITVPLPNQDELRVPLDAIISAQPENAAVQVTRREDLLEAARGLTLAEAENVFGLAYNNDFNPQIVEREKMRLVRSQCMTVENPMPLEALGGLGRLKEYIQSEVLPWKMDEQLMVRGILACGIQGTGKSLAAKVMASMLGWPLVRFDMASAKGSLVGQSEGNVRQALAIADAIAPCVLWLDEVEKGVAGNKSSAMTDGGTTTGMVGIFLTWSQEHKTPVTMFMTCNDYAALPPELIRPGRVDEKFFVDLPTADERYQIGCIHLERLKCTEKEFMRKTAAYLSDMTADFTGAEIEQVIKSAARRTNRQVTDDALSQAAREINPISRQQNTKEFREWAKTNLRAANDEPIVPKTVRKVRKEQMN